MIGRAAAVLVVSAIVGAAAAGSVHTVDGDRVSTVRVVELEVRPGPAHYP